MVPVTAPSLQSGSRPSSALATGGTPDGSAVAAALASSRSAGGPGTGDVPQELQPTPDKNPITTPAAAATEIGRQATLHATGAYAR